MHFLSFIRHRHYFSKVIIHYIKSMDEIILLGSKRFLWHWNCQKKINTSCFFLVPLWKFKIHKNMFTLEEGRRKKQVTREHWCIWLAIASIFKTCERRNKTEKRLLKKNWNWQIIYHPVFYHPVLKFQQKF